jgi:hypothetical protein
MGYDEEWQRRVCSKTSSTSLQQGDYVRGLLADDGRIGGLGCQGAEQWRRQGRTKNSRRSCHCHLSLQDTRKSLFLLLLSILTQLENAHLMCFFSAELPENFFSASTCHTHAMQDEGATGRPLRPVRSIKQK